MLVHVRRETTLCSVGGVVPHTAVSRSFLGDLRLDDMVPRLRRTAAMLGAVGNLARAAAFAAVGVLFAVAARAGDPERVGGLDLALRALQSQWRGVAPLLLVSAGFAAFGIYCFVDARYRRA